MRIRIALLLAAGVALAACGGDDDEAAAPAPTIDGVVVEDGQSNDHVDDPTYDAAPPSGGDHLDVWLTCGVYDEPIADGNAVHSLEHGAVWFAYDPELPADGVATLEELADLDPRKVLVSPYPGIESPVVAVAWERRLEVDDPTDPRLAAFVEAFVDGSAAPEPGVRC